MSTVNTHYVSYLVLIKTKQKGWYRPELIHKISCKRTSVCEDSCGVYRTTEHWGVYLKRGFNLPENVKFIVSNEQKDFIQMVEEV